MDSLHLDQSQITVLEQQGCSASDWQTVTLSPQCILSRIRNAAFSGTVEIGDNTGVIRVDGMEFDCGIYHAAITDCTIGDHVRIANVGSVVARYVVGDNVAIENTAALIADIDPAGGNGVELDVVNEAGGRGTVIFNELSAHTAYMQALMRHNPECTRRLSSLILAALRATARGARMRRCAVSGPSQSAERPLRRSKM